MVIVSLDPMSGGSLSSTRLHVPCDGELTTHTQASLALLGSWMSTRQGPAAVKSWNAMSWLWPRRPWFLLFQVGTEKLPLSPARDQSWENTFLPVGREGEVIFHFWYQCFWLSSGLALARAP